MHNPALQACGIAAQYVRVQVPIGHVHEAFDLFVKQGFLGVNITIPHKFEALQAMDVIDPLAAKLGAVNTLAIRDGKKFGYNTDGPGFLRSIKAAFDQPSLKSKLLTRTTIVMLLESVTDWFKKLKPSADAQISVPDPER